MTSPGPPKYASELKGSSQSAFDPDEPPAGTKSLDKASPSEFFPSALSADDHALIGPTQESYQPSSQGLKEKGSSTRLTSQYHDSVLPNAENEEPQKIIINSFSPRIAVFASEDTEALISDKGLTPGLCDLLKPFGEHVQGKVVIRDSVGVSRAWDDFSVRFISGDSKTPRWKSALARSQSSINVNGSANDSTTSSRDRQSRPSSDNLLNPIDLVVDQFIDSEETSSETSVNGENSYKNAHQHLSPTVSMAYSQYLRKLLASELLVPYETFSHPVAGIIAVSSRSQKPLETLRKIYADTRSEGKTFPDWVGTEYLRYYLLVHDEDTDDIMKSTALFDLMKRHFGLHCHLLRLRSTQCVESDDDSVAVAPCKWAPPEEDLSHVKSQELSDFPTRKTFIFDSDSSAIRNFIRELVTQSVVPFMESRILTWNDQVASRRRGLSGRFMSLSKRWTGLGSTKSTTSSSAANTGSSSSNFDFQRGLYAPETPEAIIRQLADYAFMLRDWKLAHSTYDFVRTDFSNDKAWTYYASAAEMAAIAFLLLPPNLSPRPRAESVHQLLDTAVYSYLTRCSMPSSVIRAVLLGTELLKVRGLGLSDDAARWGTRLLSLGILTPLAQAFVANRVSDIYREGSVTESSVRGPCQRRAAFWSVLAAEAWNRLGKFKYAQSQLDNARPVFEAKQTLPFISMQSFWFSLARSIESSLSDKSSQGDDDCIDVQNSDFVEQLSGFQLSGSTHTE